MDLRKFLLIALTTLSLALAGCHEPTGGENDHSEDGDGGSTGGDGDGGDNGTTETTSVTLAITSDVPDSATAGETVTFTIDAQLDTGDAGTSDHGGIHFWNASQPDDDIGDFIGASDHADVIDVPGTFDTNWTMPAEAGTYYYRAHLRFDGVDFWGPERQIVVE